MVVGTVFVCIVAYVQLRFYHFPNLDTMAMDAYNPKHLKIPRKPGEEVKPSGRNFEEKLAELQKDVRCFFLSCSYCFNYSHFF